MVFSRDLSVGALVTQITQVFCLLPPPHPTLGASSRTSTPPFVRRCWCLSSVWSQCWSYSSTPTRLLSSGRPMTTFTAGGPTAQVVNGAANTAFYTAGHKQGFENIDARGCICRSKLLCAPSKTEMQIAYMYSHMISQKQLPTLQGSPRM